MMILEKLRVQYFGPDHTLGQYAKSSLRADDFRFAPNTGRRWATSNSAPATDQATHPCPCCGGRMNIIETFNRGSTPQYRPPPPTVIRIDTS
jgi:hypothetical protein